MTSGLFVTALLMGVVGVPHCLVMCSVPCSVAAQACGNGRQSDRALAGALHLGRLLGYATLGALAASLVSFAHLLGEHVSALRPLWVMAQATIVVLGAALLGTGRLPQWLQTVHVPLSRLSARLSRGHLGALPPLLRTLLLGACWAILPCAQLYAAVVLAAMADDSVTGAMVMATYAIPGILAMWLGGQWFMKILRPNNPHRSGTSEAPIQLVRVRARKVGGLEALVDATWAVRATGAVLAVSGVLMLTHSAGRLVQQFCG
jgi:sulfite exporter TauE/SafE